MDFPKKQQQSLIPKYLLDYTTELQNSHPDPTEDWGGSGSTYEAGTGIDITENVISVDSSVAMKEDIPDVSDFITENEVETKLEDYELKSEAFSGDYNDLTNKPTIPVVPTNVSAFTNDAGYITSSALPTNYVTTDTVQNITGEKTFVGSKKIKLKQSTSSDKLGFTLYDNSTNEKGYLEYNPTDDGLYLGRYGANGVDEIGFLSQLPGSSAKHKVLVPDTYRNGDTSDYIVTSINNTRADASGNVTINIPDVSNYYNKAEVDSIASSIENDIPTDTSDLTNGAGYITGITSAMISSALGYVPGTSNFSGSYTDLTNKPTIPTTATSTSTVWSTKIQLTFTYSDNTTETIDLMTGATVSTNTTLS